MHKSGDGQFFPFPRTDLPHGFRYGSAERGEAVEHSDTNLELCDLTVEVACGQALPQELDAMHLGLGAASAVIPAPSSPDRPANPLRCPQDFVPGYGSCGVGLPWSGVLAGRDDRGGASGGEAERFHRSARTDWFLAFLEKYPSPHMISAMGRDAFIADAWDVVGRKVSKEQLLSDIYATASGSVGLPVRPDSDAVRMFRLVLAEGRSLVRQRDAIEARAVELLSDLPDYQLLTTIPGIGPINAMSILAEAGDLRRFRHHRQFLKFCGMDLATVQSGMFRGQSRISKYGNARLRRSLWMAGQTAVLKRTNSFRDKFERYISKDRHNAHLRRKAYTAIAAKMARTVHAVVNHGEPYRPFFEGVSPGGRTSL